MFQHLRQNCVFSVQKNILQKYVFVLKNSQFYTIPELRAKFYWTPVEKIVLKMSKLLSPYNSGTIWAQNFLPMWSIIKKKRERNWQTSLKEATLSEWFHYHDLMMDVRSSAAG